MVSTGGGTGGSPVPRPGRALPVRSAVSPCPRRTELMLLASRELLRIPAAALAKPVSPPSNLLSLFSRYVDQQKLNLLETKLQ